MRRQIIFSREFDADVERLGGYRSIDRAIETIEFALVQNPYAFEHFESEFVSFRYVITKAIGELPPLSIVFTIDGRGNVTLEKIFDAASY